MKSYFSKLGMLLAVFVAAALMFSCSSDDDDPISHPVAAFSQTVKDLTVTFTNESQYADTYTWDFGDSKTSAEANPTHTYAEAGTYTVKLVAKSADQSDEASASVTVKAKEDPEIPSNIVTVNYTESDEIIFNPERGFYKYEEITPSNNKELTVSYLSSIAARGLSLVYTYFTMPEFRDKPITQEFLDVIEANMKALREAGLKTVLRFSYTNSESQKPWDATQELVQEHIQQLKPIFQDYSDVIYVLQAGFIGVWGEWYYTDNFTYQPDENEYGPRKDVLDALLDALPENRMVCVRYPRAKIHSFGISHTDTLTIENAFDGSPLSRIAMHNDCFLADKDDTGTYGNNRNFRRYWASDSKYLAMGGETCGLSSYAACDNAIADMEMYHWSYINESYHKGVLSEWINSGCMDEIKKRLGYRFVLSDGEFFKEVDAGEEFEFNLNLKNVGFASPVNPRGVELIFVSKDTEEEFIYELDEDPRFWFAEENVEISSSIELPADFAGEYDVYLHLPDPEPTLYGNPAYSIQLANDNVWDEAKGYNKIHTFKVN